MVTNKQIAEVFKDARQALMNNRFRYICHCISFDRYNLGRVSTVGWYAQRDARNSARAVISERMGSHEHDSLETWLANQNIPGLTYGKLMTMSREMREYRLRWLDSLIKEFSK